MEALKDVLTGDEGAANGVSSPGAEPARGRQNIKRNPGETGWVVAIRRSRPSPSFHSRTFLDRHHGGEARSLAAAQAWRDEFVREHPPAGRRERTQVVRKNNTSGKTGVMRKVTHRRSQDGSVLALPYWTACTPRYVTPARFRCFYVHKYGEDEAYRLAVAAREAFETEALKSADKTAPTGRQRKPPEMRSISRAVENGSAGWRVALTRGASTRVIVRYFADRRLGGEKQSLAAAQAWRDEQERLHPKLSRKERAARISKHNTSGKTGVMRYATTRRRADGSDAIDIGWQARSPAGVEPLRIKTFAVNKYGEAEAYRLAVEARLAFEQMLDRD